MFIFYKLPTKIFHVYFLHLLHKQNKFSHLFKVESTETEAICLESPSFKKQQNLAPSSCFLSFGVNFTPLLFRTLLVWLSFLPSFWL